MPRYGLTGMHKIVLDTDVIVAASMSKFHRTRIVTPREYWDSHRPS